MCAIQATARKFTWIAALGRTMVQEHSYPKKMHVSFLKILMKYFDEPMKFCPMYSRWTGPVSTRIGFWLAKLADQSGLGYNY